MLSGWIRRLIWPNPESSEEEIHLWAPSTPSAKLEMTVGRRSFHHASDHRGHDGLEFWSMTTLPLSEVKARLSEIAEEVATTHERVRITKNGRDYVVLVAAEDLEAMEATLELLTDPEAQARLRVAEAEVADGDVLDEQAVRGLVAGEGRERTR